MRRIVFQRRFAREARLAEERARLERRAEEVLSQEELAPAAVGRPAGARGPAADPGFEVGRVYQAGAGVMAGDFYDVFRPAPNRMAAVIGDVTGHGIEPSITAFQAKYLLRVFLRQYRDPAQALEELNAQMSPLEPARGVHLAVRGRVRHRGRHAALRVGRPPGRLAVARPRGAAAAATGPLLMLDPDGDYISREIPLEPGDLVLLYTDGLAEARDGEPAVRRGAHRQHRSAATRAPTPSVLCKALLEAARDFASRPADRRRRHPGRSARTLTDAPT